MIPACTDIPQANIKADFAPAAWKESVVRRILIVATFVFASLLLGGATSKTQAADVPRYLILIRDNRGQPTLVPAQPYAYGWFGAMPSSASTGQRSYSGTTYTWTFTPGR